MSFATVEVHAPDVGSQTTTIKVNGSDVTKYVTGLDIHMKAGQLHEVTMRAFSPILAHVATDKVNVILNDRWCARCAAWDQDKDLRGGDCPVLSIRTLPDFGCTKWRER